jgi:[ribosomal protein S5]-alanine N-acetyltransferase
MLHLRPYNDNIDFQQIYRMNSNADAMRYIRPVATEVGPVRVRIDHTLAYAAQNPGFGIFMIERDGTHEVVGNCILRHTNWDPSLEAEIGYVIDPEQWGKGYATKTIALLIEYARQQHGLTTLVAFTDPENLASQHVLKKNGFVAAGTVEIYDSLNFKWVRG